MLWVGVFPRLNPVRAARKRSLTSPPSTTRSSSIWTLVIGHQEQRHRETFPQHGSHDGEAPLRWSYAADRHAERAIADSRQHSGTCRLGSEDHPSLRLATRSGAPGLHAWLLEEVWGLCTGDAPQASGFHQPLDRAAGDRPAVHTAVTAELRVDLADPIHAVVLLVHLADLGRDLLIADRPRRGRPGPRRVVGARGDRDISAGQHRADRLDPERVPVLLDVVHDQREGRSSAAAKKTDADSRIAFARRSSRTSRSSSPSRAAAAVVVPGRAPASTSAWVTQPRSVAGLIPSCSPLRRHALGRDAGS